jgi:hypothetical protein
MRISWVVSAVIALAAVGSGAYYFTTRHEVTVQLPPEPPPAPVVTPQAKPVPSAGKFDERVQMKFPGQKGNP